MRLPSTVVTSSDKLVNEAADFLALRGEADANERRSTPTLMIEEPVRPAS